MRCALSHFSSGSSRIKGLIQLPFFKPPVMSQFTEQEAHSGADQAAPFLCCAGSGGGRGGSPSILRPVGPRGVGAGGGSSRPSFVSSGEPRSCVSWGSSWFCWAGPGTTLPPPHQSEVSGRVKGDERHGDGRHAAERRVRVRAVRADGGVALGTNAVVLAGESIMQLRDNSSHH